MLSGKKILILLGKKFYLKLEYDEKKKRTVRHTKIPGGTKIDTHEGLVNEDNYEEKRDDGKWTIREETIYNQDEKRTYGFSYRGDGLNVKVFYVDGDDDNFIDEKAWIYVCNLFFEEDDDRTVRTRNYDSGASIGSSISSNPKTSSSVSSNPGISSSVSSNPETIQNYDVNSLQEYHKGDITGGIKYLECKDDNRWYLPYELKFNEETNRTMRLTFLKTSLL